MTFFYPHFSYKSLYISQAYIFNQKLKAKITIRVISK